MVMGGGKFSWKRRCLSWRRVERGIADRKEAQGQGHRPVTTSASAKCTQEFRRQEQGSAGLGSLSDAGLGSLSDVPGAGVLFWCCEDPLELSVQGGTCRPVI